MMNVNAAARVTFTRSVIEKRGVWGIQNGKGKDGEYQPCLVEPHDFVDDAVPCCA